MNSPGAIRGKVVLVLASLALNVFLLAAILRARGPVAFTSTPGRPEAESAAARRFKSAFVRERHRVTNAATASPAKPLRWAGIESSDYRRYASNLRAAGVPESVVCDILIADIGKTFGARFAGVRSDSGQESKYWQRSRRNAVSEEQMKQLKTLDEERRAAWKEVLGHEVSSQRIVDTLFLQMRGISQLTSFVSPERRDAVREAIERADSNSSLSSEEMRDWSKRQNEQTRLRLAELEKILTPDELAEFKLRSPGTADRVRTELRDFRVTPDEFRALVEVKEKIEEDPGRSGYYEMKKREAEELTKVFGPERAAEYQRGTDLAWVNARQIAGREGLSPDVADQVYAAKRSAEDEINRINTDKLLDANERKARVDAIRTSAEQRVRAALGDSGFKRYQWRGGNWMSNLR